METAGRKSQPANRKPVSLAGGKSAKIWLLFVGTAPKIIITGYLKSKELLTYVKVSRCFQFDLALIHTDQKVPKNLGDISFDSSLIKLLL
jgi:hypothetical protein